MIPPHEDPRPFAEVARDWTDRHGGPRKSAYAACGKLGVPERTLGRWMAGSPCEAERAYRALMTLVDERRA